LKVLAAVEEVKQSPQAQAIDFVSRLDVLKFADLQKTWENNVILGTSSYTKTLNEAYIITQNIKTVSQGTLKTAEVPQTTFVVMTSSSKSKQTLSKKHNTSNGTVAKEPELSIDANGGKEQQERARLLSFMQ
jgi:hypothetical protein